MLRALGLLACLVLSGTRVQPAPPLVRATAGEARLVEPRGVRALDRRTEAIALSGASGWVEAGAGSELELVWRGLASATLRGPLSVQLEREPALYVEELQVLELEVRRGALRLEIAGGTRCAVGAGALQLRSLPDGVFELLNRGGAVLVLERSGQPSVRIGAGQRVRFRAAEPKS